MRMAVLGPRRDIGEEFGLEVVDLERLTERGRWDGVLLTLSGVTDADGEAARRVRRAVGPEVPIGALLDPQTNVSRRLMDAVSVTTDVVSDCVDLVVRAADGEIRPEQAFVPVPLVADLSRERCATAMAELRAYGAEIVRRPGLLSATVVAGSPYADAPTMGASCVAIHDGDQTAALVAAQELAEAIWDRRRDLAIDRAGFTYLHRRRPLYPYEEAVFLPRFVAAAAS